MPKNKIILKLFDFKQRLETFPFWLEFPRLAPFYIHLLYKVQTNILLSEGLRPPVTINYFKIKSFRRLTKKSWLFVDSSPGQDRKTVRKFCLKWPKMLNWLNQPFLIWFRPGIYSVRPVQRLSPVAVQIKLFQNHIFTRWRIFKFHVRKNPNGNEKSQRKNPNFPLILKFSEICPWHQLGDIGLSVTSACHQNSSNCQPHHVVANITVGQFHVWNTIFLYFTVD